MAQPMMPMAQPVMPMAQPGMMPMAQPMVAVKTDGAPPTYDTAEHRGECRRGTLDLPSERWHRPA